MRPSTRRLLLFLALALAVAFAATVAMQSPAPPEPPRPTADIDDASREALERVLEEADRQEAERAREGAPDAGPKD